MQILVSDSNQLNRVDLVKKIQQSGFDVIEAVTGGEILTLFKDKAPEVAFIHVNLQDMSGLDAVSQIRQLGGRAVWSKIFILNDQFDEKLIDRMIEVGVDDIIKTPIDAQKLKIKLFSAKRHDELREKMFSVAHDLVVANRALEGIVTQDALTSMHNVYGYEDALEKIWFAAKKQNLTFSLILMHIDYFRAYNEGYGAEEGDNTIKKVAQAIKSVFNIKEGILARKDGVRFAAILPNTKKEPAIAMAESIRTAVENLNIPHKSSGCAKFVTISLGVTTLQPNFKSPFEMQEAADHALYQASHYGRNKVQFSDD